VCMSNASSGGSSGKWIVSVCMSKLSDVVTIVLFVLDCVEFVWILVI